LIPPDCSVARRFLSRFSEQGMHVLVACTLRTMEEQTVLYAQGRKDIAAVNALRRLAGMPPVGAEANRIVNHARPGIPCTTLRAGLRRRASGCREAYMERLRSFLAEGGQDREGMRTRMDGGLEEIQGVCPFPVHGLSLAENREGKRPATSRSAVSGRSPALILQMWETTRSYGR